MCPAVQRVQAPGEERPEMKIETAWFALVLAVCVATGCRHNTSSKNSWIEGDSNERWAAMARHLRGLDVAMVEIGYRYGELYWAGADANWEYADYQLTKMSLTLENALVRRPKRRRSAEELFVPSLDKMKGAIAGKERRGFDEAFAGLTVACNSCHAAEGVKSFHVERSTDRPSPIRAPR
jgi:hypothetical protein